MLIWTNHGRVSARDCCVFDVEWDGHGDLDLAMINNQRLAMSQEGLKVCSSNHIFALTNTNTCGEEISPDGICWRADAAEDDSMTQSPGRFTVTTEAAKTAEREVVRRNAVADILSQRGRRSR